MTGVIDGLWHWVSGFGLSRVSLLLMLFYLLLMALPQIVLWLPKLMW
ncbi:hypothetical protein [Marinobacterium sedimentorum]|nr:hypothetical protein [Marinobacterium sedimentorum]MCP8690237.1 hypothetical protein [Marinobacterium sedimentorum]